MIPVGELDEVTPDDGSRATTPGPDRGARVWLAALAAVCLLVVPWVYAPALSGGFVSDDHFYITYNPYVHSLSWENTRAILDPWGPPAALTLNYAPVHLLAHALEWRTFGDDETGWHVVNLLAHGVVTLLLFAFYGRSGIAPGVAAILCAFFALHPANVEAVAWIFQLKTILGLGLVLGAVLAHPRRPLAGLVLFALALLTKPTAGMALPVAAAWAWIHRREAPPHWAWLGGWLAVGLALLVPAFTAFEQQAHPTLVVEGVTPRILAMGAVALRYVVMGATGVGLSTFHEPALPTDWLDPRALAGLAVLGGLGVRTLWALRKEREEAVYWLMAAGAFLPVAQLVPFRNPVADRYLYTILPGLMGGAVLALAPLLGTQLPRRAWRPMATAAAGLAAVGLVASAAAARERAAVFRSDEEMMRDAAEHYPLGATALLLAARTAAARGDAGSAARALQRAVDGGYTALFDLLTDPGWKRVRSDPRFAAVIRHLAEIEVARFEGRSRLHPFQRFQLALAHWKLGRPDEARRVLAPALEETGPFGQTLRALDARIAGTSAR